MEWWCHWKVQWTCTCMLLWGCNVHVCRRGETHRRDPPTRQSRLPFRIHTDLSTRQHDRQLISSEEQGTRTKMYKYHIFWLNISGVDLRQPHNGSGPRHGVEPAPPNRTDFRVSLSLSFPLGRLVLLVTAFVKVISVISLHCNTLQTSVLNGTSERHQCGMNQYQMFLPPLIFPK